MARAAVVVLAAVIIASLAPGFRRAAAQCCGDCNLDNAVTVDELIVSVNHVLAGCSEDGVCAGMGLRGLQRVDYSSTADSESPKKAFAKCPTGLKVIGGGAKIFVAGEPTGPVALKASFPSDALDGWAATAEEIAATDAKWFVTAFALCAAVAN